MKKFILKSETLKIASVIISAVGLAGGLISRELQRRETEELVNKAVDARFEQLEMTNGQ